MRNRQDREREIRKSAPSVSCVQCVHVRGVRARENCHYDFRVYGNKIRYSRKTVSRCQLNVASFSSKYIESGGGGFRKQGHRFALSMLWLCPLPSCIGHRNQQFVPSKPKTHYLFIVNIVHWGKILTIIALLLLLITELRSLAFVIPIITVISPVVHLSCQELTWSLFTPRGPSFTGLVSLSAIYPTT